MKDHDLEGGLVVASASGGGDGAVAGTGVSSAEQLPGRLKGRPRGDRDLQMQ